MAVVAEQVLVLLLAPMLYRVVLVAGALMNKQMERLTQMVRPAMDYLVKVILVAQDMEMAVLLYRVVVAVVVEQVLLVYRV